MSVFLDRQNSLQEGSVLVRAAESVSNKELGIVPARFSTRQPDRHGTVFLPSAYTRDLPTYEANPVLFHAHDSYSLPVGRNSNLKVDDYCLSGVAEFDMEDPDAAAIAGKYHRDFMRGFSVRIRVLAAVGDWSQEAAIATLPDDLQKMLRDGDIWAVVTRALILEISTCGLPSNPDSLAASRAIEYDSGLKQMAERMAQLEQELKKERLARSDFEAAWAFAKAR